VRMSDGSFAKLRICARHAGLGIPGRNGSRQFRSSCSQTGVDVWRSFEDARTEALRSPILREQKFSLHAPRSSPLRTRQSRVRRLRSCFTIATFPGKTLAGERLSRMRGPRAQADGADGPPSVGLTKAAGQGRRAMGQLASIIKK
jgi:hypothetical protein